MDGPRGWPFIGMAHIFYCKSEDVLYRMSSVLEQVGKEPVRIWFGPYLVVCLKNPVHLEKVMSSSKFAYKHELYKFVAKYVGDGLITASGLKPTYKIHRRIMQPLFDMRFVSSILGVIRRHTNICMEKLESHVDGSTFDIHSVFICCSMDITGEIVLGRKLKNQREGLTKFCKCIANILELGFLRMTRVWLHSDFIFNRSPYKRKSDETISTTHEFVEKAFIDSRERTKFLGNGNNAEYIPIIDKLSDFVENNPGVINHEDLLDHLITFMPASADTFSIITSFAAVCFGMYPEYQEKAAEEIRSVIGEQPKDITLEDIQKMEYLDMCIKDVLRLFPIAPYILRRTLEDYTLDRWVIPKEAAIIVPIFNLHRDKTYWENPEHFHPDHFLPEVVRKRHVYAYIPFSAGPRGCIGKTLANVQMKIFLANLLQRFEIQADGKLPDLELYADISTRAKNGYRCRLRKREWKSIDIPKANA